MNYPDFSAHRNDKCIRRWGYVYGRALYRTPEGEYYVYERGARGIRYDLVSQLFSSMKAAMNAKHDGDIEWKLVSELKEEANK